MSHINLNQEQAVELIYGLIKENIQIETLDLSGNDIHTVPDISKLNCQTLNLDGNEISCLPDNEYISKFIEEINLSNNLIGDLQIIAFYYINQTESTQYATAIDIGLSEEQISAIVSTYKATTDQKKIEIVKDFTEQELYKTASINSTKQELLRLRSLLKQLDNRTAKGIAKLITFYIKDTTSQGFAAMADKCVLPPSKRLKR